MWQENLIKLIILTLSFIFPFSFFLFSFSCASVAVYSSTCSRPQGHTSGLLGSWNDDPEDDLTRPDGSPIDPDSDPQDVHEEFGEQRKCGSSLTLLFCLSHSLSHSVALIFSLYVFMY